MQANVDRSMLWNKELNPMLGSSCTVPASAKVQLLQASERQAQHSRINCIALAQMQANVDRYALWNNELNPKLGGSCAAPASAKVQLPLASEREAQHSHINCTGAARIQAEVDDSVLWNKDLKPKLGGSCRFTPGMPAGLEQDVHHSHVRCTRSALVQADADGSVLRSKAPTLQKAASTLTFSSSRPHTWPLLTGSHMPNLDRCDGQPNSTGQRECRSVSDGLSMPRLLLTPFSLMPVETVGLTTRMSAEDGSSTTEPCSSIGSDEFSEFLEGDPWEGCEELAAQGLAEWYRDFVGKRFGQQQEDAELPLLEKQEFSSVDQPANLLPCSALQKNPVQRFRSAAW